jgi:Leucine-rich repeat (LRR) protein
MCGFLCTDTCQPKYLFQYVSLSYNYYYKTNRINKVNKNLPTIRQSTEVALSRANTLMDVADKILAKQSTDLVDESWMEVLWQWADDNRIQSYQLPRNRDGLLNLTKLWLNNTQLTELPKEIGNLTNLTSLLIGKNLLNEFPKEIGNLVNLTELNLSDNQLTELPKEQQEWFDNIEEACI